MAATAQYASLDGTALQRFDYDYRPDPATIARRSISIFSRRGTETPESKPPFIVQAAMQKPKQMTDRQKSWLSRRSSPSTNKRSSNTPSKPKGTILNAVPPAKTIQMTPFEEEMATSPNEEIMSAITGSPISPTQQMQTMWNNASHVSLTQRTKSVKRRSTNARIGVWVNGIVQWDDKAVKERAGEEEPSLQMQTGFAPYVPTPSVELKPSKPFLSVIIPGKEPLVNDTTVSRITMPRPRTVVSIAPANIVSKFDSANQSDDVSPLDSSVQATPITPPARPKAPFCAHIYEEALLRKRIHDRSSSSSSSAADHDESSDNSNRSSKTSIEGVAGGNKKENTPEKPNTPLSIDVNKPLPRSPIAKHRRTAPAPPASPASVLTASGHGRSASSRSAPDLRKESKSLFRNRIRTSRSLSQLDWIDQAIRRCSPDAEEPGSPTLSDAADDLEAHLSTMSDPGETGGEEALIDNTPEATPDPVLARSGSMQRQGSVRSVMHPPQRAPTLPKRSRKRDWRPSENSGASDSGSIAPVSMRRRSEADLMERSRQMQGAIPATRRRSASASELRTKAVRNDLDMSMASDKLPIPKIVIDDGLIVVDDNSDMSEEYGDVALPATSAEQVLLHILSALSSVEDLFNTAQINKGMYRVYKDNELALLQRVMANQSPAAWEFREWSPPNHFNNVESSQASLQLEYSPRTYLHCYGRDLDIIHAIKALVLEHCSSVVRQETLLGLTGELPLHSQRFDDALWRIWSFCKIFGCGKGREDDVTGQLDWLKGGILANNQELSATMNVNLDYDMASVLLNPPEFFAKGNDNGLSAQQLYDMLEMWNCLESILQGYHSRTGEAREYDVFNGCYVYGRYTESQLLEEWVAHLMTLGPAVIFEMAEWAHHPTAFGFELARENGWTVGWSHSLYSSSHKTFFKEPVTRLYEERAAVAAQELHSPPEIETKELNRRRVAALAAEIKLARRASGYKRRPVADIDSEKVLTPFPRSNSTSATCTPTSPSARAPPPLPARGTGSTTSRAERRRTPNFSVPHPQFPPRTSLITNRSINPIIEERADDSLDHTALRNFAEGVAEDTSGLAVKRIVSMGFSKAQAIDALRITDMGDGLRVDRAVDLLLRRQL